MTIELPSAIGPNDVKEYLKDKVWPAFETERAKLARMARWAEGEQPDFLVPPQKSPEKRALLDLAKTPWIGLVIDQFTQVLYVDGYRTSGSKENIPGPWRTWNANRFKMMQSAIHKAALTYGYSYARALLGTALDGSGQAELRGLSPRRCFSLYEDPIGDEYPKYAVEILPDGKSVRFYNDHEFYTVKMEKPGEFKGPVSVTGHNTGKVPIVRYLNVPDLDGKVRGEVVRLIRVAGRLDKTIYDRLLAQHYNSVKIKTATGVDELGAEATDEDAERVKVTVGNEDILMHGNPEAKFGTLPETDLTGFIAAYESDIEQLAANAQLPSNGLTGKLANLSADALASARANATQKLYQRQVSFGESHAQLLRLAAHIEGDKDAAKDFEAAVTWQDMEVRSLAQAVDAWGKACVMLGVPKWAAWTKIPGVDADEARVWYEHLMDTDPEIQFLRYYNNTDPRLADAQAAVAEAQVEVTEAQVDATIAGTAQTKAQTAHTKAQTEVVKDPPLQVTAAPKPSPKPAPSR